MKRTDLSMIMTEAHRFIKIAGLELSEALKRAWANFKLVVRMRASIVKFYYQKIDGSIREAYGTLSSRLIPAVAGTDNRKKSDTVQTYFDSICYNLLIAKFIFCNDMNNSIFSSGELYLFKNGIVISLSME